MTRQQGATNMHFSKTVIPVFVDAHIIVGFIHPCCRHRHHACLAPNQSSTQISSAAATKAATNSTQLSKKGCKNQNTYNNDEKCRGAFKR
jgi:hypothetical protein